MCDSLNPRGRAIRPAFGNAVNVRPPLAHAEGQQACIGVLLKALAEHLDESEIVAVVIEKLHPRNAPIQDVVDVAAGSFARYAGHEGQNATSHAPGNYDCPLFFPSRFGPICQV